MTSNTPRKPGLRIDGSKRRELNKERIAERMAGVVKPVRSAAQVEADRVARRKADDRTRRVTAKLVRQDGGKEGAVLAKARVTISHERSSHHTIRCRPGTFEWRYGRGKPSALFHAGNHFAILWERAGVSVASSADFLRGTKSGYATGISDGRVAAIDALRGLVKRVGHFSFERLMLYCVQGATSDEIAARELQEKRAIATVLANDLRQCAIHFKFLGPNKHHSVTETS